MLEMQLINKIHWLIKYTANINVELTYITDILKSMKYNRTACDRPD